MEYVVYSLKNIVSEKVYFGRSQEFPKRKRSHLNLLRKNQHSNLNLQADFNKYGEESFTFEILHVFHTIEEAVKCEQKYIDDEKFDKYNISSAKDGGDTFTNNPRKEITRALKRKRFSGEGNPMYGKPTSQRTIDAIKKANSKPVEVDGVVYISASEYARITGLGATTVNYRLNSANFPNYRRCERKNA